MTVIGRRTRGQAPPPHIVFDALADPNSAPGRPWLVLDHDETSPTVVFARRPDSLGWSSLWPTRPDAQIAFDLVADGAGTELTWTLTVDEPAPDDALVEHLRKRVDLLVNGRLRQSFGQ